ncbi:ABC transporter permease [Streptantibioticus silvisoli]|uniref:Transport permease protein n=1 Tax=Streptantibioticus silvisoli TaxID=2705255 RepID=A0ABT6VTG5_9ACTN|nr:ABC transporter permease [Streptantibioticus silvisoli]MDI5961760.1 ABC transporter permease [Streptantibioticus silvisoli]
MSTYTALAKANYKAYTRDVTTMFFTFAFPLIFLVVFGLIFSGQRVTKGGLPYINYTAPGVLSWGVGNAALFGVAFTMMHWRRDDILRLIWRTPTPLSSVLVSRYAIALGVGLVQAVLFTAVALLPSFGLHLSGGWPTGLPVLLLGVTAFMAVGLVVGSLADTPEAVAAIANCVMIPMAFLSGAFYPITLMPHWLQDVSHVLPLRYFNDGLLNAFSGQGGWGDFGINCGGLVVFTVIFGAIATKTFRWSNGR